MDSKNLLKVALVVSGVFLALTIFTAFVLIVMSINDVNFDEYGILYNTFSESVDRTTILEEGRHFTHPAAKVYTYKRILQTIELVGGLEVNCLTVEGLNMRINLATQYLINRENLYDVLLLYGPEENWQTYLYSLTRDTVKDTCAKFSGQDFYFRRGKIESVMLEDLQAAYIRGNAFATSQLVQLREVTHPDQYEYANEKKQEVTQEYDRVLRERDQKTTDARTNFLKAEADAEILLTRAEGQATSVIVHAQEAAAAEFNKWDERAKALETIHKQLPNLSVDQILDNYLKYYALKSESKLMIKL